MGDETAGRGPTGDEGRPQADPSVVLSAPLSEASPSQRDLVVSEHAQLRHAAFRPGSTIADKYIVERVIGEGGLGVVVAARHQHLEQTVAIKYLRPKVLGSKVVTERFVREARLSAKIRSEHVVRVYDVGTLPEGVPYMVMEYLAGTDLGHVLATSGPLPLDRAVDYVLQACEALAEAHVAGIVHRDLKPDNLFLANLSGKQIIKVLDFGISKLSAKRAETGRLSQLTEANDQFGTPVYMSPEQLRSAADVDMRADVWAVGVILYELLTTQLPFDGAALPELCTAILTFAPTPLTEARPSLPASLQQVIERCLEKDRESRFQNVAELAQELRPFASQTGCESIDHILRVIQDGGERVRPSTPAPASESARALREALTMSPTEGRAALTTSSGAASWRPVQPGSSGAKRGRLALVAVAATGVLVGVALTSLYGRAPVEERNAAAAIRPAAPRPPVETSIPAAEAIDLVAPPVPSTTRPAEQPASAVAAVTTAARPGTRTRAPAARPRATVAKAAPAAKAPASSPASSPASTPFDPNAVINPFQ